MKFNTNDGKRRTKVTKEKKELPKRTSSYGLGSDDRSFHPCEEASDGRLSRKNALKGPLSGKKFIGPDHPKRTCKEEVDYSSGSIAGRRLAHEGTALEAENPFSSAQEAWFWFLQSYQARQEGAKIIAGLGPSRPCEPLDILQIVDRLYRKRRLLWDHLLVLRHYGKRKMPPDPWRAKEAKAAVLWKEALTRIEEVMLRKGIVAMPASGLSFSSDLQKQPYQNQVITQEVSPCLQKSQPSPSKERPTAEQKAQYYRQQKANCPDFQRNPEYA